MLYWSPILHFYQPPTQLPDITLQVLEASYLPFLRELEKQPNVRLTANLSGALTIQLHELNRIDFFDLVKKLIANNQLELINSPAYHPLFPLISPAVFKRQCKYNEGILEHHYGTQPLSVIFPPELAMNTASLTAIKDLAEYILIDESAVNENINLSKFPDATFYHYGNATAIVSARIITDLIRGYPTQLSAEMLTHHLINHMNKNRHVVSVNDVEVFGHHYKERLNLIFEIAQNSDIEILPISQLIKMSKQTPYPTIESILDSSWVLQSAVDKNNQPFGLWYDKTNELQMLYTGLMQEAYLHQPQSLPTPDPDLTFGSSEKHFDRGISSCHLYWLSNWPWWNPELAEKGAHELIRSIRSLPIQNDIKNRAEKKYQGFIATLWKYQWSEKPKQKYAEYSTFRAKYLKTLPKL